MVDSSNYTQWVQPQSIGQNTYRTGLMVNNSLAPGKLVEFIPVKGKLVRWYLCGPTVYDSAHLGHARTYIGQDIIKKIMRDYFGYEVQICMNITDIDDKIIKRSNECGEPFNEFAKKYETEFFNDLKYLNVEPPEFLTRVSEYIPEIIIYIQKIIDNGYAYESNGSVYFDVENFKAANKFCYGILEPNSANNTDLLNEAEGVLATIAVDKKNPTDFALWKKSKENEPFWESQWGKGRPGWHIECSVMASAIFDFPIDMHSGGIDLKFPHHSNELAQAEAYYNKPQWINYFLHTGHLNIEGLKMSKSLKNFITISVMIKKYQPRQIRLLFLMYKYDALMDYTESSLDKVISTDKKFKDFFLTLKALIRENPMTDSQKLGEKEFKLNSFFQEIQQRVHQDFCNNFNTPGVIQQLDDLMSAVNTYKMETKPKYNIIFGIYNYLNKIFKVLGISYQSEEESGQSKEEILTPVIDILNNFRNDIRSIGKNKEWEKIYALCDQIRDDHLPNQGIRIKDKQLGQPSTWTYEDKEALLKERQLILEEKKKNEEKKKQLQEIERKKQEEKLAQMKINPKEMFTTQTEEYSKFDDDGIPTHDKNGAELPKSKLKNLKKQYEQQKKLHEQYLKNEENNKK